MQKFLLTSKKPNYEGDYDEEYGYSFDISESGQDYSNTQAPESLLKPAAEEQSTYMPSYLGTGSGHYWTSSEDYWQDSSGDTVYEIAYAGSDTTFQANVSLLTYCYSDSFVLQIYVWALSA